MRTREGLQKTENIFFRIPFMTVQNYAKIDPNRNFCAKLGVTFFLQLWKTSAARACWETKMWVSTALLVLPDEPEPDPSPLELSPKSWELLLSAWKLLLLVSAWKVVTFCGSASSAIYSCSLLEMSSTDFFPLLSQNFVTIVSKLCHYCLKTFEFFSTQSRSANTSLKVMLTEMSVAASSILSGK